MILISIHLLIILANFIYYYGYDGILFKLTQNEILTIVIILRTAFLFKLLFVNIYHGIYEIVMLKCT